MDSFWKGGKVPLGVEYYNYPSTRAQRFWINVLSIGCSDTPTGFTCQHEGRDAYLLHYIRRGEMWHRIREHTYRVGKGALCLMDLQKPNEYGNDRPAVAENWWVLFNGKDMPALFAELRADRKPLFDSIDTRRFESLFRELLRMIKTPRVGNEAETAGLLMALLGQCFTSRSRTDDLVPLIGRSRVLSEPVRKGIDYMTRFYFEPKTLKDVSSIAERSMSSFVRLFHEEMGVPPMQYLNRYRIEQAKRLLVNSDKSIQEIAVMVGIPRPNYFTRLFLKTTGTRASTFRSQQKGKRKARG